MNTAIVQHVEVLEAHQIPRVVALCVWCKRDAENAAQWISLNGLAYWSGSFLPSLKAAWRMSCNWKA